MHLNQQGSKLTVETKKGKFSVYNQEDVLRIDQRSGSKALAWGSYLGAFSLVETWLILTINDNISSLRPASYGNKNKHLIIGMTCLGTLVGLLIGSSKRKYKRVYDDPAFTFSPKNIGVNFSSPNNISSLTLSYHF